MQKTTAAFSLAIAIAILAPAAARAYQNSTSPPGSLATTTGSQSDAGLNRDQESLPGFAPQAIRKLRVELYFQAGREPLAGLAPRIYHLASNSERCRLNSGAKACDLPAGPLKGSDLKQIFKYYVKSPVEARLDLQQLDIHKSDWTWQPYFSHRND
ncbi:MAG: hypothetical protein ACRD2O_00680 [Terriglobia bacterium]